MDVEVLASGRCLLGHPILVDQERDAEAPEEAPFLGESPIDTALPESTTSAESSDAPQIAGEPSRSIQTAPTPARTLRPRRTTAKPAATPEPSPRPDGTSEGSLPSGGEPQSMEEAITTRISRPWAPVEPDGPSGPIRRQVAAQPDEPGPTQSGRAQPGSGQPSIVDAVLAPGALAKPAASAAPPAAPPDSGGTRRLESPQPEEPRTRSGRRTRLPFQRRKAEDVPASAGGVPPSPFATDAPPPPPFGMPKQKSKPLPDALPDSDAASVAERILEQQVHRPRIGDDSLGRPSQPGEEPPPPLEPLLESGARTTRRTSAKPPAPRTLDSAIEPKPSSKASPKSGAKPRSTKRAPHVAPEGLLLPSPTADPRPAPESVDSVVVPAPAKRSRARKPALAPIEAPPDELPPLLPDEVAGAGQSDASLKPSVLSPRNSVAWGLAIAAVFLAGIGALFLSPGRADPPPPAPRDIALRSVPGLTVKRDTETETRLRAALVTEGSAPRQIHVATVTDSSGDVVAQYESVVFTKNVSSKPEDIETYLVLFAEGAGISADAFTERPLGRRVVFSGLLSQGQAILLFRGPELLIVITAEIGATGDDLADKILTARGL